MAKTPTFPTMIDDVFRVDLSVFKEWKLLKPNLKSEGTYNDVRGGVLKGSIDFFLHTGTSPYCTLSGCFRGVPFEKTIEMEGKQSNLGDKIQSKDGGMVYFFNCPITGKRCRKLYVVGARFGSARAFGLYYQQQALSKKQISWESLFGAIGQLEKITEELYSSKLTRSYNGKITRRYARLMKEQDRLDTMIVGMRGKLLDDVFEEIEKIETECGFRTIERRRI